MSFDTLFEARQLGALNGSLPAIADSVGSNDERDFYEFTLTQNSDISFRLSGLQDPAHIRIVTDLNNDGLVDDNQDDIEYDDVSDGLSTTRDRSIVTSLSPGRYWAEIYAFREDDNTAYQLDIEASARTADNAVDPGNTLSTALGLGLLGSRRVFNDVVDPTDRKDYYQFSLNQNSDVVFTLTGLENDPAHLKIVTDLNGDGLINEQEEVVDLDDVSDGLSTTRDRSISTSLSPGTYWAEVYAFRAEDNTPYALSAEATVRPDDNRTDPGNTVSTATALGNLSTPRVVQGVVDTIDRTDYYQFNLDRNSDVSFALTGLGNDPAHLRIVSDQNRNGLIDRNEIVELDDVSDGLSTNRDRSITRTLPAGRYLAEVYAHRSDDNTAYKLTASATAQAGSPPAASLGPDFTNDGRSEILLYNPQFQWSGLASLNGPNIASSASLWTGWRPSATGDFNNDGQDDVVIHNLENDWFGILYMNGANIQSSQGIAGWQDWNVVGSGYFNSDDTQDLLVRHDSLGYYGIWYMGGANGNEIVDSQGITPCDLPQKV